MTRLMYKLKYAWLQMLVPPWRSAGLETVPGIDTTTHWTAWLLGWGWALAGLIGGALVAPWMVKYIGFAETPYQDMLLIGVAVVAGFGVQLIGWMLFFLGPQYTLIRLRRPVLAGYVALVVIVLPLVGVGYAAYRYLTWVGADQRSVTIAFVGGLLVKTFLIPFIKGLVTGAIFKAFMRWLRGDKVKAKGA